MNDEDFNDALEQAYWLFDARVKAIASCRTHLSASCP
jgi:hypothetical protein